MVDNNRLGVIKARCTEFALILMLNEWLKATVNAKDKNFVHVILLD